MDIINKNFSFCDDKCGNGKFIKYTGEPICEEKFVFAELKDVEKIVCSQRSVMWFGRGITPEMIKDIPYETQWVCFKNIDGSYEVFYALVKEPIRASFFGSSDGKFGILLETGDKATLSTGKICAYYAKGDDFYEIIRKAPYSIKNELKTCKLKSEKSIPEFARYFGWCTWDSFYEKVTEQDVVNGLENFKQGGFVPRFVLLDDGWQTVCDKYENRGDHKLFDFCANEKFGNDLSQIVKTAKEKYGVEKFFVWHALLGYWGGIQPDSEKMQKYNVKLKKKLYSPYAHMAQKNLAEEICGVPDSDKLFDFYCDYHRLLSKCGIDGVKVDVQFTTESIGQGDGGRVKMARKYREALEGSVNLNFGGEMINCMGGSNDLTYHTKASNVTRTSDDFFPTESESQGRHIFNNAVNSLWIGGFTMCDWDMFQTKHKYGGFHAAARAISGSPVYVSDRVNEHDFDIIKKLTTSDGKLLLAIDTAKPTEDCLFISERFNEVYKLFNYNKFGGVIGAFNLSNSEENLDGFVKASDIYGFKEGKYFVYMHNQKRFLIADADEKIPVSLKGIEYEIFTFVKIQNGTACIGLTDKYNSGAAVIKFENHFKEISLTLTGGGCVGIYCEKNPVCVKYEGREFEFVYENNILVFEFESEKKSDISIICE